MCVWAAGSEGGVKYWGPSCMYYVDKIRRVLLQAGDATLLYQEQVVTASETPR